MTARPALADDSGLDGRRPRSVSRMSPERWENPGEGWGNLGNRIEDSTDGNDG